MCDEGRACLARPIPRLSFFLVLLTHCPSVPGILGLGHTARAHDARIGSLCGKGYGRQRSSVTDCAWFAVDTDRGVRYRRCDSGLAILVNGQVRRGGGCILTKADENPQMLVGSHVGG